jgi:His/Glu/Gln/Arg/opine family amino acid ABC transporter permease subunit
LDLVDFFEKFIKIVTRYWDVFLIKGLSTTLALSAIAVFFGAIIGTLLAFGKMGKSRILRGIITAYVEIIRGTPSLLQVYVGYFVVPLLLPSLNVSTYASVAIALTINSSAYVSEVIRSGIQAVDKGQTEAARSLGLTQSQAMIKVVLPQAVKNILPALGNEFITIIKETSLASTFFVGDLMTSYLTVNGKEFLPLQCLLIVGIIYFILTFILGRGVSALERRLSHD